MRSQSISKGQSNGKEKWMQKSSSSVLHVQLSRTAGVVFPPPMLRSHFMRLIVIIFLCDFLDSILLSAGFPLSNSAYCYVQGFMFTLFPLASFLFTVALSFQLYSLTIYGKIIVRESIVNYLCITISLVLTLVSFSNPLVTFGRVYNGGNYGCWCQLSYVRNDITDDIVLYRFQVASFIAPVMWAVFFIGFHFITNCCRILFQPANRKRSVVLILLFLCLINFYNFYQFYLFHFIRISSVWCLSFILFFCFLFWMQSFLFSSYIWCLYFSIYLYFHLFAFKFIFDQSSNLFFDILKSYLLYSIFPLFEKKDICFLIFKCSHSVVN